MNDKTIYQVSWSQRGEERQDRYFANANDAYCFFAASLVILDRDQTISAAWVGMGRLPDSIFPKGWGIAHWTKTSDKRPNHVGFATVEEALA